jgi:hypothetical protein
MTVENRGNCALCGAKFVAIIFLEILATTGLQAVFFPQHPCRNAACRTAVGSATKSPPAHTPNYCYLCKKNFDA